MQNQLQPPFDSGTPKTTAPGLIQAILNEVEPLNAQVQQIGVEFRLRVAA